MAPRVKKLTKKELSGLLNGDGARLHHIDLVGAAEAAEKILNVERARIGKWRRNGILLRNGDRVDFPEPITVVTTCATVRRCNVDGTLYPTDKKPPTCPECGGKDFEVIEDFTKLAATPLWWGDDIRELAAKLAKSKPRA